MFRFIKARSQFLYIILVCTALLFTSCSLPTMGKSYGQKDFDQFLNNVFVNEVTSDSITLNYTLAHPENFGITNITPTLGDYSVSYMKTHLALLENYQKDMKQFDYKSLSDKQKATYDVLREYIKTGLSMGDFMLYSETLGPTTGIQAQLPVLLSEYKFNDSEDIELYLKLLPCVKDYFKQIITFEKQKSDAGLFMSDRTVDEIIKQCENFISSKQDNCMIEVFNDRIDSFDWLTEDQKDAYKEINQENVLDEVIPAYELLIQGLTKLKGTGTNEGGLAHFPKGKQYYEVLLRYNTGSDKSPDEMRKALETLIDKNILKIQKIVKANPDIIDKVTTSSYSLTDPMKILAFLSEDIKKDYPALKPVNYSVKYVHKSLEEYLSPAFYLSPPIDDYKDNCIYINGYASYDLSNIFTTLAHEGYPGHLYQTVYFNQQNPAPIRTILNFSGYSEGWATYGEFDSYARGGLDPLVAELMEANQIATLCMYGVIDLGVNYFGWSLSDTEQYLKKFGVTNTEDIRRIYFAMIEEPASYQKYAGGYCEIQELEDKAREKLGDRFSELDFREFLLSFGPAQFDVIGKHLNQWLKTR